MSSHGKLLLIDDEPDALAGLAAVLQHDGWDVVVGGTGREAIRLFESASPDIILLDVMLPDMSGIDVLAHIKSETESTPVIVMSGVGTIDMAVEAMRRGAESFVAKPVDIDNLELVLDQAKKQVATRRQLAAFRRGSINLIDFVGVSPAAETVRAMISKVAPAPTPVLLLGESGTGKGLVARLLHEQSPRRSEPFVDLNCAGLSRELLESELFGHERGAFTDARNAKPGLLEIAAGGTLFLDELGELEPAIQARLLKAIEDKKFRRVGGVRDIRVDIRLIAATNRDLPVEVAAGRFRKDLYYRLNVVQIELPPLRQRREDIPIISAVLLESLGHDLARSGVHLTDRAVEKLQRHTWPGNVRELRNTLERAVLLSSQTEIRAEDLLHDLPSRESGSRLIGGEGDVVPLQQMIREYVRNVVSLTGGNMRKAARLLGVSPSTLYARLRDDASEAESSPRISR